MSQFLHSPFAITFSVVALLAWALMLCAIFWPRKSDKDDSDGPHILF
jgi:nitrogen fixation-related uncharacterized protein